MSPAVSRRSASAAPTIPGSRALNGGMALNRWVTPVAPSSTACMTTAAGASLCPIETRTPEEASVRTKPAGTHSGASVTNDLPAPASSHNCSRSPATGLRDPIGPVDARTLRADEGAFQMQAENPVPAGGRARRRDGGPHLLARVGDQGRQARRRAEAAVRPGDGAHAVGCRLIVEQNAAAAIDLQIDEAGGEEDAGREARLTANRREPRPSDATPTMRPSRISTAASACQP